VLLKCVYSIDDLAHNQIIFYIKQKRGQDSGETERERGRENEHWAAAAGAVSVVKLTVRKYTCF
jgi:hypothetical protein